MTDTVCSFHSTLAIFTIFFLTNVLSTNLRYFVRRNRINENYDPNLKKCTSSGVSNFSTINRQFIPSTKAVSSSFRYAFKISRRTLNFLRHIRRNLGEGRLTGSALRAWLLLAYLQSEKRLCMLANIDKTSKH